MWTKILTFCVVLLLYGGRVRGSEDGTPGDQTRALQFLRNVLSKDSQQSQIFKKLALGRSRRDAEKECGGTVQVEVGSFQSPGFPRGYAQDLLCVWTIQAPASKQVLLRFMSFDVKGGSRGVCNPGEDYVMMRDGSRTGKNLGIFCNALMSESPLPSAILSVTNEVWIIFHTNRRDEGKGFLLSIQAVTSVKFSDYIADQITFEPSTEAESSSAGRPSTEVIETTKAPTTLLRRLSVNPATTFPFTQESDQLTIAPGDKFSFESVAIGNPQLGTSFFGNSMGSFVGYTNPPPSDTPTTVTDLITHPDLTQTLPKDTTDSRSQPQSTSQLQTVSSTDGVTSHHELQTGQPIMQSKEQSTVLTKSFGVTNKQQEATETELLPVAQTELKFLTGTEQIYLLQSDEESVSLPDLQQATGVTLLPVTEPEQYTVTQVRDVSDAKQPSVSNTDSVTKSWQQFVTQIEELPVTEVKQEPLTKPDELQPSTRSLPTEQETITLTKQLLSTSNLIPTTQPGPQIVTQTGELTNLNGLQELTSSWQQIISQTVKLQTHAKQQPVTKSNGPQLVTMLLKEITVPTIQPSVSEIDNQEPGIQTGKQVGTESYKTQSLTMAKTDVQQPVTPAEQLLTEIYELQPVTMRRQQSDSPTGPLDPLTDKPQYLTEPDESWIRTEQDIATQTDAGDIGTQQPTEMFTYQEQGSTAEYQPISTTEVIVSNEPKETISQQHLPSSAKSASTTEQHLDVKTQWQALTTEQRRPTTDPEADRQVTVPPSVPPTLPPPPPSLPPLLPTLPRLTPLLPSPPPPFSFPDITPEPGFPSKEFDHPLTQSLSQVFNTLVNVNLHDRKSIIQACQNLNETMNETLESFKSLPRLVQGLEYTKSLLTASLPVEMLSVNFSGDAALDNPQLFQFLLIQSLEDGVSEIITQASQFLNYTIQNVSRIQSDIPEASCIRGYSQQLLNALQRDTSITGSLALVNEVFNDLFGVNITKKLPPRVDDYQPDLAPDEEPWDFNQVITNPSGELQSPNYPDAYPMGVRYRWNITARPHGLISLNFTHFDLDSALIDNQCDSRYAHITVVDGSGLETERKHVYCGQEVPEQIVSSSNLLIVMFISSYGYGTGFHADFAMHKLGDFGGYQYSKTVVPDRVCGGVLTQRRGSIKSPNYPGDFETSVDCQWIVTVEAGLTISLNFTDFNLDSFPVDNWCSESYAHVKVDDGSHGSSRVYCGQELPPLFISSTNSITISFVGMYGSGGKFFAFYEAIKQDSKPLLTSSPDVPSTEPVHPCGGNLEDSTGVIQSPNYPGDFETSVDCQWIVTVDSGLIISLNFTDFNLDSFPVDTWCSESYAHVKVIDGSHGSSHVFCGQEVPPYFISTTNTISISFVSMFGYGGRFHAFYKAIKQDSKHLVTAITEPQHPCGGNLEDSTGVIQSPNYPGNFETSVDCQWIVTVEAGLTISLNFTDLNLDSFPVDNWCSESYTHVKVIDGIHGSSHVFCGQEVPPLFISSTNTLTVTFVSMYGYGGRFHAVYTALLQDRIKPTESVCGGNFNKTRGVIQLPDHLEGEFEMGLRCQWNITVDITEVISFIFTEFNLDSLPIDDKCNEGYAHVKVVEGSGKSNIYCGQEIPLSFITTTNTLLVVFDSSYGYSDRFRAVYRAYQVYDSGSGDPKLGIEPSSMSVTEPLCGGSFNQPSGSIQLPEQTSDNCRWNITVESGWIILLTFTTFDIDSYTVDGQCDENYAHVKVTDQQSSNIFCGQNVPPQVTSRSRTLIVDYVGVYGYGEGFEASYVIRDADFATLEASQVTDAVSSPSASTQAQILTDETLYQCGEDLNLPYGTIQSPSYLGDQATGGRTCRWTITVGDNLLIQLAFTDFNLDSMAINGECDQRYDYLKIVDGETQVGSSEFVYCGQDIPNIYVSSSNDLIVIFYTSYGYSGGFTAEYKVVEPDKILPNTFSPSTSKSTQAHLTDESSYKCGGDLNLPYGTIQSPSYSGDQATGGRTCRWTITVGDNLLIQLAFTDFNLDSMSINGECDQRYDYLKIVDGETKEFLYCGQDIPNIYVSSSNYLIVIFYTSYGYSGGFTAEYSVMEPDSILTNTLSPSTSKLPSAVEPHECGGDISTPTGEIKSPNPGDYTTGVNCVWKITLDASSKVVLRFTVFNVDSMPVDNECDTRYAHVLVVDGSSEETSPKHVYCGQDLPEDFVSTSNSLIIAFISQYGYGGRFKAGYSPLELEDDYLILLPSTSIPSILGCGGILDSPDGVIQSPDLSTMERTQSINCKWYIELQEAGTITIVFEYFDLDSVLFENGCEEMYANLKIIDTSTGVSQVYCGQEVPPSFVASTNELLIVFSGLYGFSRGFRAEYHSTQPLLSVDPTTVSVLPTSVSAVESQLPACGSILREDYAEFSTPGYPNLYPFNTICSWHIFVDSTHFIALKFLDFDIDNPMVQPDCSIHYSYVRVSYQGESGIQETHLLCGSELPEILKMRTHSAVVYFKSNLGMGQGFKASYQAYSQSSSDVWATAIPPATVSVISPLVLIAQSGQILSPNYPVQFPHNVDKLWIIRPARQTFITLIFEDIDFDAITGESGQCNTLYTNVALTTFNIDRGYSEFLICSNQMTTAVYSYGELKLAFHSTYGIGRGFRATYSSDIRFGDFGFVTEEPDTPTPIQSQSTYKEYVMNTRNPIVEITDGCLYTLTQSRGHFSSPDYPSMYPQEVVCQWIMLAPSGWLVRLDFSQFLLDSDDSPPCDTKYSHLVITTSDAYGGRDYTYCGQQLPPRIISPTNRLVVTFRSMFGIDFGFVAAYQFISAETYQGSFGPVFIDRDGNTGHGSDAEKTTSPMSSQEEDSAARVTEGSLIGDTPCERVFSNPEGVIRSPYFPQGMPQGEECTWTITVPGEKGIHLSFLDFYLDDYEVDTSTCSEDSASVSVLMDGSLYEFCGNVPPSPLISTGNSIIVELKTMSGNGPGFRMHFIDASLVSADSVTSHKTGDITESGTSGVDFRFLGDDGMTVPPNGDKRDFTQPDRERVNVPVPQSDDPSAITASTPVSGVEDEVGSTGTINTTTVNKDNMETLSGYTSVAKTTGTASTADAGDVLTSHQLRVTAIVCGSVSFILFFLLILLTTICIYKRRRRHSSKTVNMGQSEKNYWQNYKSWAREYTGGPNKLEVADEEGVEAVPIPEQERLV
ncbi:cubilin-like isoform X1 [Asterias rubens]|uniref:cubilin-like isoform X1 n=1 Tax=Asterias rubens TaxID=7604 RepID=UPI001455A090|nr:cubilin-like isoform X1 [Asterias rubens]